MGVYANTVSIAQFQVSGELPKEDLFAWFSQKLRDRGFQSIEHSTEELAEGWTLVDRADNADFEAPSDFWRDNYLVFSLRRDQRRIPAALLKSHAGREEAVFLAEHPNMRRAPKKKREEIKELVQVRLLARCLPVPSSVDVVWDAKSGVLTLFSLGSKIIERFEDIFRKTFDGFSPILIHPLARARTLVDSQMLEKLEAQNKSTTESIVAQIRDNQWLGWEFQLWLLQRGLNGEGEFAVSRPGHVGQGERFAAWIDDRIQLQGGSSEGGVQKVSVSGSQESYQEAISALKNGKQITSSTIYLEKDENIWKLTLKGETFGFASFKCPQVRIERDATVEEISEREAAFYERMFLLEQGVQLFDSLFKAYLEERLSDQWPERMKTIQAWLEGKEVLEEG